MRIEPPGDTWKSAARAATAGTAETEQENNQPQHTDGSNVPVGYSDTFKAPI